MVKTYQLSKEYKYGTLIKIAPVTTESELNAVTCLQVNGTNGSNVEPQSILPDLTGFQYIGIEPVNGLDCEKWRLVDVKEEKVNKYTVWIRYKYEEKGIKTIIPVMYEMRGYNTLLGSHYDHYYLMYDWFSPDEPSADVFKLSPNVTCSSFPGPGDKHIVTFNPMSEFINNIDHHVESEFDIFKRRHNKQYEDLIEHGKRKEIFRQNLRFINSKNREVVGYQLGVNHLADRTDLELKALRGKQYSGGYNGGAPFPYTNVKELINGIPSNLDWRLYGAVTPVKDQSVCGSCWSFGTTGTIEGAYFLKYGHQVRFSQQALIDCSWGFGNNGCDGGEDFRSYQWMMKHGGLPLEDDYGGYLGQDGYCHVDNVTLTGKIKGYVNVTSGDEDALKVALAKHGPISVAISIINQTSLTIQCC
ncbi:hypothetical protein L9F63_023327, partial [Diploptera punctata]